MESLRATSSVRIYGTRNCWSLEGSPDPTDEPSSLCDVGLEIQGTPKQGYHLVMSPEGFFTADYWFETKADAFASAEEMFGVAPADWTPNVAGNE